MDKTIIFKYGYKIFGFLGIYVTFKYTIKLLKYSLNYYLIKLDLYFLKNNNKTYILNTNLDTNNQTIRNNFSNITPSLDIDNKDNTLTIKNQIRNVSKTKILINKLRIDTFNIDNFNNYNMIHNFVEENIAKQLKIHKKFCENIIFNRGKAVIINYNLNNKLNRKLVNLIKEEYSNKIKVHTL